MIISVTNLKGGVGKTTISTNLAVGLVHIGYDVCIVDTDEQQQSAMEWSSSREAQRKRITVVGLKEKQLEKDIFDLATRYDIILVDGSPQLDRLANVIIAVSDVVLIPISPSIYDYRGFERFYLRYQELADIAKMKNKKLEAYAILNATKPNSRVLKDIEIGMAQYDLPILQTKIADRVSYVDSAALGLGVVEYRDAKAKLEMEQLTQEIETIIKKF